MARKGLGKGLDSLIPDFYNEDFDSNSPQSLEDMLNEKKEEEEVETQVDEEPVEEAPAEEDIEQDEGKEDVDEENDMESSETGDGTGEIESDPEDIDESSEDLRSVESGQEVVQAPPKIQVRQEHIDEVKQIVDKNPRITLWSSRSAAVFRYLRKTEPEFSISKEASVLIDEAVAKKFPEIWALFDDY